MFGYNLSTIIILSIAILVCLKLFRKPKRSSCQIGTDFERSGLGSGSQNNFEFDGNKALDIFFKVQSAWTSRDMVTARNFLTEEMYRILQTDVEKMKKEQKINKLQNIGIRSVDITESWEDSGQYFITARIIASLLDYTVDEVTGKVLDGSDKNPTTFEEYWTFSRLTGNNQWQLSAIQQASNVSTNPNYEKDNRQISSVPKPERIPASVSFLQEFPSGSTVSKDAENDVISLLNLGVELHNQGNDKDSVRCFNKTISLNPSYIHAIGVHRNRAIAIGSYLGLGKRKPHINLDYCIAVEHMLNDFEAIIGLYVTNEGSISERSDSAFFKDCFNMAMSNYMPYGLSIGAYEDKGSYHRYQEQLSHEWEICFVHDPRNALSVNGKIYPHHRLPK